MTLCELGPLCAAECGYALSTKTALSMGRRSVDGVDVLPWQEVLRQVDGELTC